MTKLEALQPERIAFLLILTGLLILLIKIVIPNMGVKSIPVSWMTASGAIFILFYGVFYELKEETTKEKTNTIIIYSDERTPYNIKVFHMNESHGNSIIQDCHQGRIKLKKIREESESIKDKAQLELVVLNIIDHLTTSVKDWRKSTISTPLMRTERFRLPEDANGDAVLNKEEALISANFETIEIGENWPSRLNSSIYPKGSTLVVNDNKVHIENAHFKFETIVTLGNREIKVDDIGPNVTYTQGREHLTLTSQEVSIGYTLKKLKAGHHMREDYRKFGDYLVSSLKERLEAPSDIWPRRITEV